MAEDIPKKEWKTVEFGADKKPQQMPIEQAPTQAAPPKPTSYHPASSSRLDQPPEPTRFQRFKESLSSAGQRFKSGVQYVRTSRPVKYVAGGVERRIITPARGFAKETVKEAKTGLREGKEETRRALFGGKPRTKEELQTLSEAGLIRKGARSITGAPVTAGRTVKEAAIKAREDIRSRMKSSGGLSTGFGISPWHGGLGQRNRYTGQFSGRTKGVPRIQVSFRAPVGTGRQPRFKLERGIIKTYWSKKLKKAARTNIRRFGTEKGLEVTRQVAALQGWKMQ